MHRRNGRGSAVIDLIFPGIGRIRRSSGTDHPRTYEALKALLRECYATGRHDILRAVRDGELKPIVLLAQVRERGLDRVALTATLPRLTTMADWAATHDASEKYRRDVGRIARRLADLAPPDATTADVPGILRSLRTELLADGKAVMLSRIRAAAMAWLRDVVGRDDPSYRAVRDLRLATATPTRAPNPQPPAVIVTLAERLGPEVWTMAATGMGPAEAWGAWELLEDRVAIHGTKRTGRERVVPRWRTIERPRAASPRVFADALREATNGEVQPYDLRRTFANWLVEAAVPANRRKSYLGHGARSMTELYERPVVTRFLAEDAAALAGWYARQLPEAAVAAARRLLVG